MRKSKGYTKQDLEEVQDHPEWTTKRLREARPFAEPFPDLADLQRRAQAGKTLLSLPVDDDVVEKFRASGPGWPERMNEALKKAVP